MQISADRGDLPAQVRSESALGYLLIFSSADNAEARMLLNQARARFDSLDDRTGLGETLEHLAYLYQQASDLPQAQTAAEALLQNATALGDSLGICAAHGLLGVVYLDQGDFPHALDHLEQQLTLAAEIDNQQDVIYATSNLGAVYLFQSDYPRALDYWRRALDTAAEIGYRRAFGAIVGNLGEVYRERGETVNALHSYERALYTAQELGDRTDSLIAAVGNVAVIYAVQGRSTDADALFPRAVALARQLENPYGVCEFLYQHALFLSARGQQSEALPLAQEALQIAEQIGRSDLAFKARVLALRCSAALSDLQALLGTAEQPAEQAAIHDAIWSIDGDAERAQTAAALYADLYTQTFRAEYRERYRALTGNTLPDPPALPPLPDSVAPIPISLEELITRLGI